MTKPQRAFTLILAMLFLATSVAFTVLVVAEMLSNKGDSASVTQQLNQEEEGGLQGTKLEDFEPVEKVDKLKVVDIKEGEGEVIKKGATVTAHYTGAIASTGVIFQSSHDIGQPVPFTLVTAEESDDGQGVISGWVDGVPGMKVGGKRRLLIPAKQAYGEQSPSPDIPANADMVFDIEVVSVE